MTEEERLIVVKRIDDNVELMNSRIEKKSRLDELKKNEIVKEYLQLSREVKKMGKVLKCFDSEEKILFYEFVWAFIERNKGQDFLPCNHDILVYDGSYYVVEKGREKRILPGYDEDNNDFVYNVYRCLECDKTEKVENWQKFESEHFVLKNYKTKNAYEYIKLYYQLLYNHTVEEARNMVIEQFNYDLVNNISQVKTKRKKK